MINRYSFLSIFKFYPMKLQYKIAGLFLGALSVNTSLAQEKQSKPNFLFLLTDDQTYESIHALNNSEIKTPNLDKLSKRSVVFTHCFNQGSWSAAICVASRSMIITGQSVFHASKNKSYLGHGNPVDESKNEASLWGEVLGDAGYQTYITGKWHNSKHALLKSFDHGCSIGKGMYASSDEVGVYNRPSATNNDWTAWDKSKGGHWTPSVYDIIKDSKGNKKIGARYTSDKHTSELYADQAITYLQNNISESADPFFMYVAFNAPHDPRQSPKEFVDLYPVDKIKTPSSFLSKHPFDQGDSRVRDEMLAPFPRTNEAVAVHQQEYYAIISHVDREIGKILKALEVSGKADNTYIIFSSDHGLAVGRHGLMGKQNQYDHSVRMPLMIAGPGIQAGHICHEMVYLQSIFATSCDLAGIDIPKSVDFPSLKSLLKDPNAKGENLIFGAYKDLQRMIRSKHYKLIVYPKVKKLQLFNLKNDPDELVNLANKKRMNDVKSDLLMRLFMKQKELGDFLELPSDVILW